MIIPNWHSREDLPFSLNKMGLLGIGVCVGVQRAVFEAHVRRHWSGKLLIGVDPWKPYKGSPTTAAEHEEYRKEAVARLNGAGGEWTFVREPSLIAARQFAETQAVFDFVYIDGAHEYEAVAADLAAWWPLVKSGGVLAGHDWVTDGYHRNNDPITAYETEAEAQVDNNCGPFGVRRAVREFAMRELVGNRVQVTEPTTDGGWQSWGLIKP